MFRTRKPGAVTAVEVRARRAHAAPPLSALPRTVERPVAGCRFHQVIEHADGLSRWRLRQCVLEQIADEITGLAAHARVWRALAQRSNDRRGAQVAASRDSTLSPCMNRIGGSRKCARPRRPERRLPARGQALRSLQANVVAHTPRSVSTGSVRVARRAGPALATTATPTNRTIAVTNVRGSVGEMP